MKTLLHRYLIFPLQAMSLCGAANTLAAVAQDDFVQQGHAAFVVSHIRYALAEDADKTGACPDGMTAGYDPASAVFVDATKLQPAAGEADDDEDRRVISAAFRNPGMKNLCLNPELGTPNPSFKTVSAPGLKADGIDMDGIDSNSGDTADSLSCAHDDFAGMHGQDGIDNQFYRVVGCSKSFQSTGSSNLFEIVMYEGSWGILVTLDGVDDLHNDDHVEVGFYSSADPLQLSPTRAALPYATYAKDQDPDFRSTTIGRITDGVLTTDPVDVRFHWVVNSMLLVRPLDDARVQLRLSEDGTLEGYLAGYNNVEELYDFKYGFRNGKDGTGQLAPLRLRAGSSVGAARVLGHTCEGAYYTLYEHADAKPDPETGKCTAISVQYRIEAIPAFVVDTATQSINEELHEAGDRRRNAY